MKNSLKHKKTFLLSLILVILGTNIFAQPQLKLWSFPPNYQYSFTSNSLQPFLNGLWVTPNTKFHNILPNASGAPYFAITDADVLDNNLLPVHSLTGLSSVHQNYFDEASEFAIVPIPNLLNQFYLIGPGFYYTLNICDQNLNTGPISLASFPQALPSTAIHYANGIAISKPFGSGNSMYFNLYIHNESDLFVYTITQTGINLVSQTSLVASNLNNDLIGEMECVTLSNGHQYVAFATPEPYSGPVWPPPICKAANIWIYEFDANGAPLGSNNVYPHNTLPVTNTSQPFNIMIPKGLEFSPNGNYLYYTAVSTASSTYIGTYIGYIDLSNGLSFPTAVDAQVSNDVDFMRGMIELGYDGALYFHGGDRLAKFQTPNNPSLISSSFINSAVTFPTPIPISHNINSDIMGFRRIYTLPDQIDGFDYSNYIGNANPFQITASSLVSCSGNILLDAGPGYETYSWSNGASTQSISVNTSGTYTVTVTYACTNIASASISVVIGSPSIVPSISNLTCNNSNNGSISLNVSGGTSPYSYNWSNGNSTNSLNNLTAGTYTVTVTDINGCSSNNVYQVTQPSVLTVSSTSTSYSCTTFGTATAIVGGGSPPYSYVWNNGGTAGTITGLLAGTYTVTVQDANGCTTANSVQVQSTATNPQVTIQPSPVAYLCPGGVATLTASSTSAGTYLWSNGFPIPTIQAGTPGNYTVTFTDQSGCKAYATTTVSLQPNPTASISGVLDLCNSTTLTYSTPINSNCTYQWFVNGGSIISNTGNQITVNWLNNNFGVAIGGYISVYVTNITTGCYGWHSVPVTGCCALNGVTNYLNHQFNNISISGALTINGNCNILGNVDFTNANITMGPNASLNLMSNSTLILDNTKIRGCNYMWKGIYADHAGESIIVRNNSIIEDAENAISSTNFSLVDLTQSVFNKNWGHLVLDAIDPNSIIQDNSFTCFDGTSVQCLLPPHVNLNTETSVTIFNSTISIGSIGHGNEFTQCENAIDSETSFTTVINNNFHDINYIAINSHRDGSLRVVNQNDFINVQQGVNSTENVLVVDILDNRFVECQYAIINYRNDGCFFTVDNNMFIDNDFLNIQSTWNLQSAQVITNNSINESQLYNLSIGIIIGEPIQDPNSTYYINGNIINGVSDCINGLNLFAPEISNNIIDVDPLSSSFYSPFGIKIENCNEAKIVDNTVTSDPVAIDYYWTNGIQVDLSPESYVVCNSVGNIGRGLWFGGLIPGSTIAGNKIGDCFDQFFINWNPNGLGDIGCPAGNCPPDGFPWDNEWNGVPNSALGGHQTFAYFSNDMNVSGQTIFNTRVGTPFEPFDHFALGGGSQFSLTNPLWNFSDPSLYCETQRSSRSEDPLYQKFADNTAFTDANIDSYKWLSKNYLLNKLKTDSVLANSSLLMNEQLDSISTTNIGLLDQIKDSLILFSIDSVTSSELNSLMDLASSVTSTEAIEIYLKAINQIYLNKFSSMNVDYSNSEWRSIKNISERCPYEYGPAVYSAKVLRFMKDRKVQVSNPCIGDSPLRVKNHESYENSFDKSAIMIVPNPNNGIFNLDFRNKTDDDAFSIEIIDTQGRIIDKSSTFGSVNYLYQNPSLARGLYLCKIYKNGTFLSLQQFIVN